MVLEHANGEAFFLFLLNFFELLNFMLKNLGKILFQKTLELIILGFLQSSQKKNFHAMLTFVDGVDCRSCFKLIDI